MNLLKLAKYLSWEFINKKEIKIIDFIDMLENNIELKWIDLALFKNKFDWITTTKDYYEILNYISQQFDGSQIILFILNRFWLNSDFINYVDLNQYINIWINFNTELSSIKNKLLIKMNSELELLNKSKSNKWNWNWFEELCENFLLHSSYFEPWFKEFEFEDKTEKIDRLLKLKKDIWAFSKKTNYLWYVILEAKFKKENQWLKAKDWAWEVSQLKSYIERLNGYWISKYAIIITSSKYKNTYNTIIWDYCRKKVIENNPFYISLLTIEEIKLFLENKWNYENMSFDEFIERSFIKWLK